MIIYQILFHLFNEYLCLLTTQNVSSFNDDLKKNVQKTERYFLVDPNSKMCLLISPHAPDVMPD